VEKKYHGGTWPMGFPIKQSAKKAEAIPLLRTAALRAARNFFRANNQDLPGSYWQITFERFLRSLSIFL
jgi:hypothetical protein